MKYEVARREAERCFMLREDKIKSERGGKHLMVQFPHQNLGQKHKRSREDTNTETDITL